MRIVLLKGEDSGTVKEEDRYCKGGGLGTVKERSRLL